MSSSRNEKGSSQNEMLFMRGNAMSGAPIMMGTNQLPKPPISAGMTMKKIMISPCMVMCTLYRFLPASIMLELSACPTSSAMCPMKCQSGFMSCRRIITDMAVPTHPAKTANTR